MSTTVADLRNRGINEMKQVNWSKELQKTIAAILKDKCFEKSIQTNKEYTRNLQTAHDFIKREVLDNPKRRGVYPETFFFAIRYFLLLIDEEHSRLERFKYQGLLAAYPLCVTVQIHADSKGERYILFDQVSGSQIVSINGKPAMQYIENLQKQFPCKSSIGAQAVQQHAQYLNILNPFFPIKSITTETREFDLSNLSRGVGILQPFQEKIQDPSPRNEIPSDVPFDYFACRTFSRRQWDSQQLRSSKKPLIVIDLRGNGGGYEMFVIQLLKDILSIYCPPGVLNRAIKDFKAFKASRINTEELQYQQFLETPAREFKELIREFNQEYKPDKRVLGDIYRAAKKAQNLPVVAIVISDVCYSACRSACRIFMALPNTVFVGSPINVKDPVSVNSYSEFNNGLVKCILAIYPRLDDHYQPLKADLPGHFDGSGMRVCLQILKEFNALASVVKKKLAGKHRKFLFVA